MLMRVRMEASIATRLILRHEQCLIAPISALNAFSKRLTGPAKQTNYEVFCCGLAGHITTTLRGYSRSARALLTYVHSNV